MKGAGKRNRWISLRINDQELAELNKRFEATPYHHMSEYIRLLVFEKPVVVRYRSQSMDEFMEQMIVLRVELNAVGNNFNQVVRKLHSVAQVEKFGTWLQVAEEFQKELLDKVTGIQRRIDEFAQIWLQ
ncbi:plasmid mobilization relaxosome protein MobC [Chitinophaga sp. YIM B06452]|uniref:plasmid mobilization protein n=1 Tax=Chitinophaga sp. YIM B06452 TaxID=3082158 RepID=UPI0031FEA3C4